MRQEMPFQAKGVAIDLLSPEAGEDFLEATLGAAPGTMMEAPPLVYMKLKSPRRKDQVDVIEMIKGGIDTKRCRESSSLTLPCSWPRSTNVSCMRRPSKTDHAARVNTWADPRAGRSRPRLRGANVVQMSGRISDGCRRA